MSKLIDKLWMIFCSFIAISPIIASIILIAVYNNWTYIFISLLVIVSTPVSIVILLFRTLAEFNSTVQINSEKKE